MSSYLNETGLAYLIGKMKTSFISTTDTTPVTSISIDSSPTNNSSNLVTSGGVYTALSSNTALSSKQDKLIISSASHNNECISYTGHYYIITNAIPNAFTFRLFQNSQVTGPQEIIWNFTTTGTTSTPSVIFQAGNGGDVYIENGFNTTLYSATPYKFHALWNGTNWYIEGIRLIKVSSNGTGDPTPVDYYE